MHHALCSSMVRIKRIDDEDNDDDCTNDSSDDVNDDYDDDDDIRLIRYLHMTHNPLRFGG